MKLSTILLAALVAALTTGCGSDTGVVTNEALSNAKLKDAAELPADMSPQARMAAQAATGQAQAAQQDALARANAMAEMAKQRGR